MKKILFSIIVLSICFSGHSQIQNDNVKAKIYYQEALKLYNQANFSESLKYINQAEEALGSTNARILALKVNVLYSQGSFTTAKQAADRYINYYMKTASAELNNSVTNIYVNIDEAAKEENKRRQIQEKRKKNEKEREIQSELERIYYRNVESYTEELDRYKIYRNERLIHNFKLTKEDFIKYLKGKRIPNTVSGHPGVKKRKWIILEDYDKIINIKFNKPEYSTWYDKHIIRTRGSYARILNYYVIDVAFDYKTSKRKSVEVRGSFILKGEELSPTRSWLFGSSFKPFDSKKINFKFNEKFESRIKGTEIIRKPRKGVISNIKGAEWSYQILDESIIFNFGFLDPDYVQLYINKGEKSRGVKNDVYYSIRKNSVNLYEWKGTKNNLKLSTKAKSFQQDNFLSVEIPLEEILLNNGKKISLLLSVPMKYSETFTFTYPPPSLFNFKNGYIIELY